MNKQVMIDGIDVSECKFYESNGMCSCSLVYYDYCKDFPNCVYKLSQQLKRKEQECECLKLLNNRLNSALGYRRAGKKTFIDLSVELDQLKEENKDLKNAVMLKCPQCGEVYLNPIGAKLYETLNEIKEIAESEMDNKEFMIVQCMLNGSVDDKNKVLKQILQKISEVQK